MVRFKILSGKKAGSQVDARRFPFRAGRAAESDLMIEEPGVWDRHCEVAFDQEQGFVLSSVGAALVVVNGQTLAESARLRNGDIIEVGACRLQFWLGETIQQGSRLREMLVWVGIALVTLAQVLLIYRLIR